MEQHPHPTLRILRIADLQERLGRGRSTIYAALDPGSPTFDPDLPQPVRWGKSIGFIEHEVDHYIKNLMEQRLAVHPNRAVEER